ncbi:hypothetical protein [Mycobacterium colombiense]|uniref:hypothetical protein n=1 Tax=Mycobacterium colombiense TaxID=339268 RepID=UPI0012DB53D9|nr:hypothetical protein [Mycobacterium colombiense]
MANAIKKLWVVIVIVNAVAGFCVSRLPSFRQPRKAGVAPTSKAECRIDTSHRDVFQPRPEAVSQLCTPARISTLT